MRIVAIAFTAFLLSFSAVGAHAGPGLAIGLELDGNAIRQVSAATIERIAAPRTPAAATWTLRARDADGAVLWSRPVVAPRQHHGNPTRPLRFVLTLPQPALGNTWPCTTNTTAKLGNPGRTRLDRRSGRHATRARRSRAKGTRRRETSAVRCRCGRAAAATRGRPDAASVATPDTNGECLATYIARLSPGTYSLAATPLGWPEKALSAVTIVADARRDVDAAFPLAE